MHERCMARKPGICDKLPIEGALFKEVRHHQGDKTVIEEGSLTVSCKKNF